MSLQDNWKVILLLCVAILMGCVQIVDEKPLDEMGGLSTDEEAYLAWAADAVDDVGDVINEVLNDDSKELDRVQSQLFYLNDVAVTQQPPVRLAAFHHDLIRSGTLLEDALRAIDDDGQYDWTEFFEAMHLYLNLNDELATVGF